ncbi:MAG: hypothetical protein LBD85_01475 [Oscillospiraceae bacterium]|jgi:hypothetical protein|nr:hypothetical protein [Oscillospiraceae bacterium]
MDMNFHYFAVKTIADFVGFSNNESQMIAEASQLVDDFDLYMPLWLNSVPEYAASRANRIVGGYRFRVVTTGFNTSLDMINMTLHSNPERVVTPFHFIPRNPRLTSIESKYRAELRVTPAKINDGSLIAQMLEKAKKTLSNITEYAGRMAELMHIGMLLHTFADTYAHQLFSGSHGWENHASLIRVIKNKDGSDITEQYEPEKYHLYFSLGHANLNHAPDDTFITFTAKLKQSEDDKDYSLVYTRNNGAEFLTAAKEIAKYLCACKGTTFTSDLWERLEGVLAKGFLSEPCTEDDIPRYRDLVPDWDRKLNWERKLDWNDVGSTGLELRLVSERKFALEWSAICADFGREINFGYNRGEVFEKLIPTSVNWSSYLHNPYNDAVDLFFKYNMYAQEQREIVMGINS